MPSPTLNFDWRALAEETRHAEPASTTRHRLRWLLAAFALLLAIVWGRAAQLELTGGEGFRRHAARPSETIVAIEPPRGRILARDGSVLAMDRPASALAVHFRYLESPPDPRWLRRQARLRLTRSARRDPAQVAAAEGRVRAELEDLHRRLAALCGITAEAWQARTDRIERRVHALAETVNRRHRERQSERSSAPQEPTGGFLGLLSGLFAPPAELPPAEIFVAEQDAYHGVWDELSVAAAAEIRQHPAAFPGVEVVERSRRAYPQGTLAANLVGYVGRQAQAVDASAAPDETISGLLGVEGQQDARLRGLPGRRRETRSKRGQLLAVEVEREAVGGRDVVLSIEPELQRFAEQLLDRAARRTPRNDARPASAGGAVLVMDVHSGEILTAASEPRFDPGAFAVGDESVDAVLADPRRPLFDRATRMAIPPGSVFKPLVGLALVSQRVVSADTPFYCQGYFEDPDHLRCQKFRRLGIGHDEITLADALAQSCNVYFFHHARSLGGPALLDWAGRFGFGQPSAPDWSEAAVGSLPRADELRQPSDLQAIAIGQGTLTATPLEVVRMYAAIANGGYLVEARFTRDAPAPRSAAPVSSPTASATTRIAGIDDGALAAVCEGLRRTVDDPDGTGFDSVRLDEVAIAGKTGTAETGDEADHAWFAGYVPAEAPRWAFVVVLEHGGSGAADAGVVAKNLVRRMHQLGYFAATETAEKPLPPGKG
jgi:penicillin-binding protein 2